MDIQNGQLRDVDASTTKVPAQEIADDSATLIARALGQAANVAEVLSEATHFLLDRIRLCPQEPGDGAHAQDDQQMLECRADVCPTSWNRIRAGALR
ncbi:hypothetical protein Tamer19_49530 [Cupriavidus sp. TA19]|nr:hypothetical protein Tamer19_49530 [Cupriavidus sp. TA19]